MAKVIFWLAALVAVLGAMVTAGRGGGLVWGAAIVAALIMVRRSWPRKEAADESETGA